MVSKEDDELKELRKHAEDTVGLFANAQKPERERMVCRCFQRGLGVSFSEEELRTDPGEPVDVSFQLAQFQITEILDKGRKRQDELRERQRRYQSAESVGEAVTSPDNWSHCPVSYREVVACLYERLSAKAQRYGIARCATLDALVYVNLRGRHLWPMDTTSVGTELDQLQAQRWRSVSMLFPPYSVVVFAGESAPEFLRNVQGQAFNKWPHLDGCFDP